MMMAFFRYIKKTSHPGVDIPINAIWYVLLVSLRNPYTKVQYANMNTTTPGRLFFVMIMAFFRYIKKKSQVEPEALID